MNLKEIQQFVIKKAVMAAHPECMTLDEALKKEIVFGCKVKLEHWSCVFFGTDDEVKDETKYGSPEVTLIKKYPHLSPTRRHFGSSKNYHWSVIYHNEDSKSLQNIDTVDIEEKGKIIGLPLTLSRILNTCYKNTESQQKIDWIFREWELLKPDGTDAFFQDQTEEMQKKIAFLLGWEES